jgi:quinol monooxygenase YgiN
MTVHKALLARLEAKPGMEAAVRDLLTGAVALANQEARTTVWFALQLGPSTFGVFDAFADEDGRQAHLNGAIAQALIANTPKLLSKPPQIDPVDVLSAKLA